MASTVKIVGLALMVLLGAGLGYGGFYANQYINDQIDEGIEDNLVIEDKNDEDYEDWTTNAEEDDVPKYKKYYFWNLTNPDGYLQGDDPLYQEVGPYTYRQNDIKIDVSFADDEVTYKTYTYYTFQPDMSSGLESDTFTNINPAYQGVVAGAGSEQALATGFVGPTLQQIMAGLKSDFVPAALTSGIGTGLDTLVSNLKNNFVPQVQTSAFVDVMTGVKAEVVNQFYAVVNASTSINVINQTVIGVAQAVGNSTAWADYFNSTSFSTTYGVSLHGISEHWNLVSSTGTLDISELAQDLLINGSNAAATALSTPELALGWFGDFQLGTGMLAFLEAYQAVGDSATFGSFYNLTAVQTDLVVGYLANYMFENIVPPTINGEYGVDPPTLAEFNFYTQWANGTLVPDPGIDLDPSEGNELYGLEAGIDVATNLNLTQSMDLFDSTNQFSFMNDSGVHIWFNATYLDDATYIGAIMATFGLDSAQWNILDAWYQDFRETIVPPNLIQNLSPLGVSDLDDLAYLQWANSTLTEGASLSALDPSLPGDPEIWAWAEDNGMAFSLLADESKELLDGTFGLTNGTNVLTFFTLLSGGDFSTINTMWGLDTSQATTLAGYLQYYNSTFVVPQIVSDLSPFGVASADDLAYFHWGSSLFSSGISAMDFDSSLSGYPELWAYMSNVATNPGNINDVTLLKGLLSPSGFFNSTNAGALLQLVGAGDFATVTALFGLNQANATAIAGYFQYLMSTFITDTITPYFQAGGGLVTSRTVTEWLWEVDDPLLQFLAAQGLTSDTSANLFTNHTSSTDPAIDPASTIKTGKGNLDEIYQYVQWQGLTEIAGVWQTTETITGTDATQFAPDVGEDDVLTAYVSDLLRVVDFEFDQDVDLHGIDLMRFKLNEDTLAPDANYYQTIKGIANMSAPNDGVPIFLSKPHFLDSSLADAIGSTSANVDDHDTYVDVETNTGAVMRARKRLQLNTLTSSTTLNFFNTEVSGDYMPVVWIEEGGTLDSDSAEDFKSAIYSNQNLANIAQIAGPVVGAVLIFSAIGIGMRSRP